MSKSFSPREVSKHNIYNENTKDVWVSYKGNVYDVSKYLESHPGGEDLILEYAGGDITAAFTNQGHSEEALQTLESFKIGTLVSLIFINLDILIKFFYRNLSLLLRMFQILLNHILM